MESSALSHCVPKTVRASYWPLSCNTGYIEVRLKTPCLINLQSECNLDFMSLNTQPQSKSDKAHFLQECMVALCRLPLNTLKAHVWALLTIDGACDVQNEKIMRKAFFGGSHTLC